MTIKAETDQRGMCTLLLPVSGTYEVIVEHTEAFRLRRRIAIEGDAAIHWTLERVGLVGSVSGTVRLTDTGKWPIGTVLLECTDSRVPLIEASLPPREGSNGGAITFSVHSVPFGTYTCRLSLVDEWLCIPPSILITVPANDVEFTVDTARPSYTITVVMERSNQCALERGMLYYEVCQKELLDFRRVRMMAVAVGEESSPIAEVPLGARVLWSLVDGREVLDCGDDSEIGSAGRDGILVVRCNRSAKRRLCFGVRAGQSVVPVVNARVEIEGYGVVEGDEWGCVVVDRQALVDGGGAMRVIDATRGIDRSVTVQESTRVEDNVRQVIILQE